MSYNKEHFQWLSQKFSTLISADLGKEKTWRKERPPLYGRMLESIFALLIKEAAENRSTAGNVFHALPPAILSYLSAVCVCTRTDHSAHVEVRGQLEGTHSLLPPC